MKNYFDLFELNHTFDLDLEALDQAYQLIQSNIHPDRFAKGSDMDRRLATQYSSLVNDAYETLSLPLKRAIYLLKEKGIDIDEQSSSQLSTKFLMKQLELREAMENIEDKETISNHLDQDIQHAIKKISTHFQQNNFQNIKENIQELQFLTKLRDEY